MLDRAGFKLAALCACAVVNSAMLESKHHDNDDCDVPTKYFLSTMTYTVYGEIVVLPAHLIHLAKHVSHMEQLVGCFGMVLAKRAAFSAGVAILLDIYPNSR